MLKVPVSPEDHIEGDLQAPVLLVEYGDYECPHCGHAYPIVKRIQKHFGKKIAFVYRNFPLTEIHPNAEPAAETAEFAGTQNRFWPMHDAIFEHQTSLSIDLLFDLAETLKLPPSDLANALDTGQFTPRVKNDFTGGVRSGVNGTPTFFINNQRHDGPFEFENLLASIEAQLQKSPT